MSFGFTATYIALWGLVLFQTLLILALLRQLGEIKKRIDEGGLPADDRLPTGTPAPALAGTDLRSGEPAELAALEGQAAVLLFLAPACTVCKGLSESLGRGERESPVPMIAICQGKETSCATFASRLGPDIPLIADEEFEISSLYRVTGSPTAVVLNGDHAVRAYGHPREAGHLDYLVERALAEPEEVFPGEPAAAAAAPRESPHVH